MNAVSPAPKTPNSAEQLLTEALRAHRLLTQNAPTRWLNAIENALEDQISDYGRLLLPCLGLGERIELDERYYQLHNKTWRQPPGELWHFDACYPQSWIHAALLHPFEMLDNWIILVPRTALTEKQARALSPPLIPRVGHALANLDWIVADYGGHGGGRLKRNEFLTILGELPWIRIEHYAKLQVIQIQRWQGDQILNRWRANIPDTFGCTLPEIDPRTRQPYPAQQTAHTIPDDLHLDPHATPLHAAALLDILGDPYATLRRFTKSHFQIDVEQLGPLFLWRDFPDELFEFDDSHDTNAADISFAVAESLALHHHDVRPVLHTWFKTIENTPMIELPIIGTLHPITIPELPQIPPAQIFVASTLPPSYWMQEIPPHP